MAASVSSPTASSDASRHHSRLKSDRDPNKVIKKSSSHSKRHRRHHSSSSSEDYSSSDSEHQISHQSKRHKQNDRSKKSKNKEKGKSHQHRRHKHKDKEKQQEKNSGPVQLSKLLGRDKGDSVRRSAVSGKKILLKLEKTKEDKLAENNHNELLKFLNASYD
ncbi:hypothetical protein ACJIZ3_015931 [Penstemon smallii]|uniref:Uncharacterized protein n=1 Tax=Penstemon smallii TaxID=265156 RepID=A0ABD3RP68_9LAMI